MKFNPFFYRFKVLSIVLLMAAMPVLSACGSAAKPESEQPSETTRASNEDNTTNTTQPTNETNSNPNPDTSVGTEPDTSATNPTQPSGGDPLPDPLKTAKGEIAGEQATAIIGIAGGTLTSLDGLVTLEVPPDALVADTQIGIQPITNLAPGSIGQGYRFTPANLTFAVPASISYTYTDVAITGSAPEYVSAALQNSQGQWELSSNVSFDKSNKRIKTILKAVEDLAWVRKYSLVPDKKDVKVNGQQTFYIERCYQDYDFSTPEAKFLGIKCEPWPFVQDLIHDWSVDGKVGGDKVLGTITPDSNKVGYAIYLAPSTIPKQDNLTISVRLAGAWKEAAATLIAYVRVVDADSYFGYVEFNGTRNESGVTTEYSGTAYLDYRQSNVDLGAVTYTLITDPIFTGVSFDKWTEKYGTTICTLVGVANTPTPNLPIWASGSLNTYSGLNSYAFGALMEVVGKHKCVDSSTNDVTYQDTNPRVLITTAMSSTDLGIVPMNGDGAILKNNNVFNGDQPDAGITQTQTNKWSLVKN